MKSIRTRLAGALPVAALGLALGLAPAATPAAAQTCHFDTYVDGSLCVGIDCVCNGGGFGFDTIQLKENNLRIKFQDTSVAASFPTRDWQILVNDSTNGGLNRFSIVDVDGGTIPFTIEGDPNGAGSVPANSLYIDNAGNVGFGTANPAVELHVVDGDSPTLRLEQDGSSGFTPQTWDVAGNEANFFVRDATNGSKLPFKIIPNADTNNLVIRGGGVAFNANAEPDEEIHVFAAASGNAAINLDANAAGGNEWIFRSQSNGSLQVRDDDGGTIPVRVGPGAQSNLLNVGMNAAGNAAATNEVNISGNLIIAGTCSAGGGACDGVFSPDYPLPTIEEHAAEMWAKSHLPGVGPTPDDATYINVFQKTTGILNELEKAHIYIEQLHRSLQEQRDSLQKLQARLDRLEASE